MKKIPAKKNGAPVVEEVMQPTGDIELAAEKYGGLRDIRARMDALHPQIATLSIQIEALSAQRSQLAHAFIDLDRQLNEGVRAAATEHGIQLDGQQSWRFNIPTLTFSRAS